jgi:uncharacterized ferredoxin-like protein
MPPGDSDENSGSNLDAPGIGEKHLVYWFLSASRAEVILTVAKMIIALPLSVSAKNILFDRL